MLRIRVQIFGSRASLRDLFQSAVGRGWSEALGQSALLRCTLDMFCSAALIAVSEHRVLRTNPASRHPGALVPETGPLLYVMRELTRDTQRQARGSRRGKGRRRLRRYCRSGRQMKRLEERVRPGSDFESGSGKVRAGFRKEWSGTDNPVVQGIVELSVCFWCGFAFRLGFLFGSPPDSSSMMSSGPKTGVQPKVQVHVWVQAQVWMSSPSDSH